MPHAALTLLRSGFRFWFSREEIQELSRHNRQYETPRLEQELVMRGTHAVPEVAGTAP